MSFTLLDVLQSLIAFQALLFAAHLSFGRRGKRIANRSLAALLVLLGFHMIANVARSTGFGGLAVSVAQVLALLYGPLFFLYVRDLVYDGLAVGPEELLHAVPAGTFALLAVAGSVEIDTLAVAIFASVGTYLALSWLTLRRYTRIVARTRSDSDAVKLGWLRAAMSMLTVVWLFDIASYATSSVALPPVVVTATSVLLFALLLAFVTAVVIEGLRHPQLFAGITADDEAIAREGDEARGEATGTVDDEENGVDVERLERYMREERPYLEPDLTIAELAARVGIPARRLSRLVNGRLGTNFSEYVNSYRIVEATERLAAPGDEDTILDLLYAVGFNSKSAFNTAFKRKTGVTPSAYRRRLES